MHSEVAARIFHDWAVQEGFWLEPPDPTTNSTPQEIALIAPKTGLGRDLLRAKEVHAVASNEAARRIIVFTRKAIPKSKKQREALPKTVGDVDITYRQGATIAVGSPMTVPTGNPPYVVRQIAAGNVYACGSSISVGNFREAGTFGCLVRDADGNMYGLSNNHVTASCNFASVGLPILAPGVADVAPNNLPPFTVGFHHRALTLVAGSPDNIAHLQNTDAAIFRISDPQKVTSFQGNSFDTPANDAPIEPNQIVEKVGRTTGHTTGRVIGKMQGPVVVPYAASIYGFSGSVFLEPVFTVAGQIEKFSDSGDSGSLVVTAPDANGNRSAVGIIFGKMVDKSAPGELLSLVLPISSILQRFSVSLVHGHNI